MIASSTFPFDRTRNRVLLIAFPNGTKGHLDGVKQIVDHFNNGVTYYEPRNEPNFGASGSDFVKNELADFYHAVKGVKPDLKVLGPGTVTTGRRRWMFFALEPKLPRDRDGALSVDFTQIGMWRGFRSENRSRL